MLQRLSRVKGAMTVDESSKGKLVIGCMCVLSRSLQHKDPGCTAHLHILCDFVFLFLSWIYGRQAVAWSQQIRK